ncbi:MAG TPA: hypothetical protein VE263_20450 [Candidatus Angelobacter sp.]|nr:hypothetical protein [Candidatus Angelobacter sp.]
MKTLFRYAAGVLGAYFVAWTISYVIVMYNAVKRLNFSEYFHWLQLAWTFRGLEMVAVTWLMSIVLFLPLAGAVIFLVRRMGRHRG